MAVKVKICGVRTLPTVEVAVRAGADYLGVVFFAASPRNVTLAEAALITKAAAGRIATVAVLVDADDDLIADVMAIVGPNFLQLHGDETAERMSWIKERYDVKLIKALSIGSAEDLVQADAYWDVADIMLFDAKPTPADRLPGGNGLAFEWAALAGLHQHWPFALSGGLTPDNVAEAIRITGAVMVDVSSGVERAPGEKDDDRIRRFIQAAKSAVRAPEAVAS